MAHPLSLSAILCGVAAAAMLANWRRTALWTISCAFLVLSTSIWTSLGPVMLRPLEERFARPEPAPSRVDGIVVLGGGLEGAINSARGGYELNAGGDRFVEAAVLARRYPQASVLVSGGSGALLLDGEGDADTAPRLLSALGVEPGRLILENRSRNTAENAAFSRDIIDPQPDETWLLLTSAFHMPRSIGLFRKVGFAVVPWPTDYQTTGTERLGLATDNPLDSMRAMATAIREWIGLVAYRLTGRIDTLFPAP